MTPAMATLLYQCAELLSDTDGKFRTDEHKLALVAGELTRAADRIVKANDADARATVRFDRKATIERDGA